MNLNGQKKEFMRGKGENRGGGILREPDPSGLTWTEITQNDNQRLECTWNINIKQTKASNKTVNLIISL